MLTKENVLPAILRPGFYAGEQGTRTVQEWTADAVVAYQWAAEPALPRYMAMIYWNHSKVLEGFMTAAMAWDNLRMLMGNFGHVTFMPEPLPTLVDLVNGTVGTEFRGEFSDRLKNSEQTGHVRYWLKAVR